MSASVLLVVLGGSPAAAGTPSPTGSLDRQGLTAFEWHRLSEVNPNVSDERLWSLRGDGFSAVYADVGEWLEAADQPDSRAQRRRLRWLAGDLRRVVARASSLGLAVHAVAGGPNWTAETHRYLGPRLLQLVAAYNSDAAPDERLQGVQFDIEPYVDSSFWDDVQTSLQAYLRSGPDGSIEHVRRELDHASQSGAACGIVVGQEFTAVTPEKLSWWAGRAAFRQAAEEHTDAYGQLPQFRGIAVDDMDAYQEASEHARRR